ncbi:hypothetical protein [Oceanisphaera sp. W20_SRM_FM3]|uniref:hypothetical protein n=1 Tax=Oceanisphaera sp. W20_SRM_FM3 TaxID=3240267 RepID=UPI003F9506BC
MKIRNTTYTKLCNIPNWIYEEAKARAKKQPVFLNSHRKDQANNIGCLGEVIAEHWMRENGIKFTPALKETTHDYIVNDNLTIEVKTKDRTVPPREYFDNSTPLYNHTHQKPDYFLFVSLERNKNNASGNIIDFHSAYLVGSIGYEELDSIGIIYKKNEVDNSNGIKFWTDCLNIKMSQLIPIKETKKIFKGKITSSTQHAEPNYKLIKKGMR